MSKPNLTCRQLQAREMKQHIFENAIRLFQTMPYDSITISDICKAADISVGIFYYYFKNKDAVLNQGIELLNNRFKEKINDITLPPIEKVFYALEVYIESVQRRGSQYMSVFMHNEILQKIAYDNNPDRIIYSFIFDSLKEAFDVGKLINGNPKTLYFDIIRILKGTIYDWIIKNGEFSLYEEVFRIVNIVMEPHKPKV